MECRPWTDKSKDTPYIETRTGRGNGEEKAAVELSVATNGQNCRNDMGRVEGGKEVCEVKELDRDKSFKTGANGRDAHRPLKVQHCTLINICHSLSDNPHFTKNQQEELGHIGGLSADEMGQDNLARTNNVCTMLNKKRNELLPTIPSTVQPFTDSSGKPLRMSLPSLYTVCKENGIPFPPEYIQYESTIQTLLNLNHPYIEDPSRLMGDLKALNKIFTNVTLIIVHEQKGYMFVNDIDRIQFLRVTLGVPRFRVTI